jgi:large subunit ribosomal protein L9
MEVILREHIDHLGRRGEIVTVADGYARNYLLPRKLALAVTDSNKRQIERERNALEVREATERSEAEALAQRIAAVRCVVARKVGETDTLYGSVTAADIADQLAQHGISVDRRKVQLNDPIKQLGDFTVPIRLHRDVIAQINVSVVREEG